MPKNSFDSKEYAWKDIDVMALGRIIGGLEDVSYTRSVDKERRYGRGNKARSIQTGNEEISGSITVHQSELSGMNQAAKEAGFNDITEVPLDLIVRYASTGEIVQTIDKIQRAEVSEYQKGMSQGDKYSAIELPFIALALQEDI
ncbi:MAG: hypothetical protein K9J21_06955 [Bacteroidales bacterium]|nr:hypothetical protein [Bacteroidales bacterium]